MKGHLLNSVICTVMVLGILMIIFNSREVYVDREGFVSSGIYPESVDKQILTNSYPLKTPGGLSSWNYSSQWKLFPIWADGSYAQKTNNIKNWPQPCNGTAAPADLCGVLYNTIKVPENCISPPPKRNCKRVNYYCLS